MSYTVRLVDDDHKSYMLGLRPLQHAGIKTAQDEGDTGCLLNFQFKTVQVY